MDFEAIYLKLYLCMLQNRVRISTCGSSFACEDGLEGLSGYREEVLPSGRENEKY